MDFQVIPAIDIRGGRCVRLFQGQYDQETVFADDPVEVALRWQQEGASRIHIVDLDGARAGKPQNLEVVRRIVESVTIPVGFGGGLRDLRSVKEALESGIERAILGTAAIEQPGLVKQSSALYGDRIAVAIDAREGTVMIHGWTDASGESAVDVACRIAAAGARRVIYTDISRDGTLTEPNFEGVAQMLSTVTVPVVASGGISRVEHLVRLRNLGAEGAVVGKALYTGAIRLPDLRSFGML